MNYSYIERCMSSTPSLCGVNGLKELLGSEVCRRQSNWKIHVGGGREIYGRGAVEGSIRGTSLFDVSVVGPLSNT